jgi:DNA-binding transcriptional regulator YiaG
MLSRLQALWKFARGKSVPSGAIVPSAPNANAAQMLTQHAQKPEILTRLTSLGITQTEFAAIVGVKSRTVSNWVRGRTRMSEAATVVLELLEDHPDVRRDLCVDATAPYAPRGKPFAKGNPYRFGDRRRRTWVAGARYARAAA